MAVKKPTISLRVYKGSEVYYDKDGNVINENQIITLTHDTLSWRLFLQHITRHGYAAVDVERAYFSELEDGKEKIEEVKELKTYQDEVEKAFNITEEVTLTPEQLRIQELEAKNAEFQEKLDSLITSKVESATKAPKKSTTGKTKIQLLRAEYYELAGKRCAPSWDEATLELKINEFKA